CDESVAEWFQLHGSLRIEVAEEPAGDDRDEHPKVKMMCEPFQTGKFTGDVKSPPWYLKETAGSLGTTSPQTRSLPRMSFGKVSPRWRSTSSSRSIRNFPKRCKRETSWWRGGTLVVLRDALSLRRRSRPQALRLLSLKVFLGRS